MATKQKEERKPMQPSNTSSTSVPKFSPYHPIIPKLYICAWRQDMKNRDRIVENCILSNLSYHAEDSLYLEKRERLNNVESREVVMQKGVQQPPKNKFKPPLHSALSKYQSSLMSRTAED